MNNLEKYIETFKTLPMEEQIKKLDALIGMTQIPFGGHLDEKLTKIIDEIINDLHEFKMLEKFTAYYHK